VGVARRSDRGAIMSVERARSLRKQMPPAEARLWNALRFLKPLGFHFRRQVPMGRYYADFASHQGPLVVEVDGETHFTGYAPTYDAIRDTFIRNEGYRVLRISNHEVMHNLEGVMTAILLRLQTPERVATPTLNPSPQGGGRRRSRAIVEVGHRSLSQLPPPRGEGSRAGEPHAQTHKKTT
jgi:very-short-patch-repair endonuclease